MRQFSIFVRQVGRFILSGAVLAAMLTGRAARAYVRETIGAIPHAPYRVLVMPVDLTNPTERRIIPNHQPWRTADLLRRAFFERGFAPRDPDGRRAAFGSIADYVRSQFPGFDLEGDVVTYPASAAVRDGWYQFDWRDGEDRDLTLEF